MAQEWILKQVQKSCLRKPTALKDVLNSTWIGGTKELTILSKGNMNAI